MIISTSSLLFVIAILLYVAYFFILPILSQSNYQSDNNQNILNTELYTKKLAELQSDLNAGTIDQEGFSSAEKELKLQLLSEAEVNPDKVYTSPQAQRYRSLLMIVLAIPLVTAAMYSWLGNPGALKRSASNNSPHSGVKNGNAKTKPSSDNIRVRPTANQLAKHQQGLITQLKAEIKAKPKDIVSRYKLAQLWQGSKRFSEAAAEYREILRLIPKKRRTGRAYATFLASYADVLGAAHGNTLKGAPMKYINQALAADPNHHKALHLAGTYYYRQGDYEGALKFWKKLITLIPEKSPYTAGIKGAIADAERKLADKNKVTKPGANDVKSSAGTIFTVTGTVTVDVSLNYKAAATDVLFIFAKQVNGPPRPLAAIKATGITYPYSFTLSDKNLLVPGKSLKDLLPLVITAKIAKSSNASSASTLHRSITVTRGNTSNITLNIK